MRTKTRRWPLSTQNEKKAKRVDHTFDSQTMTRALFRRSSRICRLPQSAPVSFDELEDAFTDRSFAALLTFFAILNLSHCHQGPVSSPEFPSCLFPCRWLWAANLSGFLPFMRDKTISPDRFRQISAKVVPWLQWLEQFIRPRNWPFGRKQGDRWLGVFTTILGHVRRSAYAPFQLASCLGYRNHRHCTLRAGRQTDVRRTHSRRRLYQYCLRLCLHCRECGCLRRKLLAFLNHPCRKNTNEARRI